MNMHTPDSQNSPLLKPSDVYKFIPCSMWPTYICCVMYDGYPKNNKDIDITVCLRGGRVIELFQRECVSSIFVPEVTDFTGIQTVRNIKGELFYLVVSHQKVIVLSSIGQLSIHKTYSDVIFHEICDPQCTGEPKLMIVTESGTLYAPFGSDNDVHEVFNRNLESTKPVVSALARKLIEAKYNLDCHERAYKDIEKLRQQASLSCHDDDSLKLISKPIIRFCNNKIIIQLDIENLHETLKNVCVLIHNNSCNSISYTTKVYEHLSTIPFYKEIEIREIKSKCKATLVAVIPIREFKNTISSRIDFSLIVSYEQLQKTYLQSFDDVHISAGEVMGKNFDVFNSPEMDERYLCMAMLSTTTKTVLCIKQRLDEKDTMCLSKIFCLYLNMDLLGHTKMLAIHKHSPHHTLHGVIIVFDDNDGHIDKWNGINYNIDVYTRSPSQVLALIHFIYEVVPFTLTVTTPNIQVTPIAGINEDPGDRRDLQHNFNYIQCAKSLLNQSSLTLEYLDNCLKEMNKSNVVDKTDIKIELFAMGRGEFAKYRSDMLREAKKGFEDLVMSSAQTSDVDEIMEIE